MQFRQAENPNHPPPPPPPSLEPYSARLMNTGYLPHYPELISLAPNPNRNVPFEPLGIGLRPPGMTNPHLQTADSRAAAFYADPYLFNAVQSRAVELVRNYGSDLRHCMTVGPVPAHGTDQLASADWNLKLQTNARPHGNGTRNRGQKKNIIVQSAWCEICKVECNSKDVLDTHKMGRRHKKNLEKLNATAPLPPPFAWGSTNPVIGPKENPFNGQTAASQETRKRAPAPIDDMDAKMRKILKSGTMAEAIRTCTICNVICNSDTAFSAHLAGQKHAAMVNRLIDGAGGPWKQA